MAKARPIYGVEQPPEESEAENEEDKMSDVPGAENPPHKKEEEKKQEDEDDVDNESDPDAARR